MKTILVFTPCPDKSVIHSKWQQPLGLAYIAAVIKDISDVLIIDCEIDENYVRTLIKEIKSDNKLVVAFSTTTYSYEEALKLAKIVKDLRPDAHINFGGYHATALPNLILKNRTYVDSVIRGDGELPFRQLIKALEKGNDLSNVGNLTYRKNGKIVSNPEILPCDLDSLPYPAREFLDMETCFSNLKNSFFSEIYGASRMVFVNATRGCPNHCNYCCLFNRKWRPRNPKLLVEELEYVKKQYDSDIIYLVGDNLNFDWRWLLSVCKEMINKNLDMKWVGVTANPVNVNKELLNAMEMSGCISTVYGFETASIKIQKNMNRVYQVDKYQNTTNLLKDSISESCASFILGYSGESRETLKETISFIKNSNFDRILASILAPLPGTEPYMKILNIMPELKDKDIVPIEEMKKVYIDNFCSIGFQELKEVHAEILSLSKINFDSY